MQWPRGPHLQIKQTWGDWLQGAPAASGGKNKMKIIPVAPLSLLNNKVLGCPICKRPVYDKGYGFIVCKHCDILMHGRSKCVVIELAAVV